MKVPPPRRTIHAAQATGQSILIAFVVIGLWAMRIVAQESSNKQATAQTVAADAADGAPAETSTTDSPDVAAIDEDVEPAFDEIPWNLRPYRVRVSLAYGETPSLTTRFRRQLQSTLDARIRGVLGSYWQCDVETNDWLLPSNHVALERQTSSQLTGRYREQPVDKVLLLCIEDESPMTIAGWEWDGNSQTRGPVVRRSVIDRRLITDDVFGLLIDLFRPVARIDATEGDTAELIARGAELLAPESVGVLPQAGDLLTPHFRYLTREGEVRSVQSVPWTYLRVDEIERSRLVCGIETAFATAMTGTRRRVELMAIRARPVYPETKLRLVPRTNPNMPLVGIRARVYDELPSESAPDPSVDEFMSDRFGTITIKNDAAHPVRRLLVHSGGAVLANLPFVAGLDREATLEVPDDAARLEVEGNLAMIEGELIDLVSRRSVMLARALAMARTEKWDEQESIIAEVDKLPGTSYFQSKIIAVRVPGIEKSQANRDGAAEKRIKKMAAELEELVTRYLDPTPVRDVKAEIKELRQLAERSSS